MSVSAAAHAQGSGDTGDRSTLEEVVVTATRQADTVNRVPLSVTATTQRALDQRGILNVTDLQGRVPALTVSNQATPALAQITIRGIQNVGAGAATTGFYLDDTPLTKRGPSGGGDRSIAGSPIPPLFDLERIEVLRGPQGTLYGGSSEGGTIRFITPAPSLTRFSTYARAQVSQLKDGGTGWEAGVAAGGPIVQDKLGFRASAFARKDAGYIDLVNEKSQVERENVNARKVEGYRAALTWAPVENARVTLAYFYSRDKSEDLWSQHTASIGAINIPALTYNYTTPGPGPCGTVGNTPVQPRPVAVNGIYLNPTAPNCTVPGQVPGTPYTGPVSFVRPGGALAPITFGEDDRFFKSEQFPANTVTKIPTLTLEYDFPSMTVRSITSYIQDKTYNLTFDQQSQLSFAVQGATVGGAAAPSGLYFAGPAFPYPGERQIGRFYAFNNHFGLTQEIRFSSNNPQSPLNWVAGVFYSNSRIHNTYENLYFPSLSTVTQALYGLTAVQQYGTPAFVPAGFTTAAGFDHKDQTLKDVEVAAFGEATYKVTDKLRLTSGIRVSRVSFDFAQAFFGPINGFNIPTVQNQGLASGSTQQSPITPKVGAQYFFTDADMVYLNASKGFRAGGVNTLLPLAICGRGLSNFGLTPQDIPTQYGPDTVWNYEAGAKTRLLAGRGQINAAVYRIDWSDVQLTGNPGGGCGIPFNANAGKARSQGFELEAQLKVGRVLTLNGSVAYDDAKFLENAPGISPKPGFPTLTLAYKDQSFDIAPWTVDLGARFDQELAAGVNGYMRVDWRYASKRKDTLRQLPVLINNTPTNPNWYPDYVAHDQSFTNLRLGIERGGVDLNVFVNNLFNKTQGDAVLPAGRASCQNAACSAYGFNYQPADYVYFTPRQIGVQIAYRH